MNKIVYGATCAWWDSIDKVGKTPPSGPHKVSIPCCPHCQGVLFEVEAEKWDAGVAKYDALHPGYRAFTDWRRGKCYPRGMTAVAAAYRAATGLPTPWEGAPPLKGS